MDIKTLLHRVDELRPNSISDAVKIQYLNEIEGEVFDVLTHYEGADELILRNLEARKLPKKMERQNVGGNQTENPGMNIGDPIDIGGIRVDLLKPVLKLVPYDKEEREAILLLPDRFAGVYTSYIVAKINFQENESDDYNNAALLHQAERDAWMQWMNRSYMHHQQRVRGL